MGNKQYKNAKYEPFIGLSNSEIIRLIQSSTTKKCEISSAGQYYIEGMTEFIRSKKISPYCEMYVKAFRKTPRVAIGINADEEGRRKTEFAKVWLCK